MEKRKCKFIIGNGFDLYGGMNTTFFQYYKKCLEDFCTSLDQNIVLFFNDYIEEEPDAKFNDDINDIKRDLNIWDYILYKLGYNKKNWFDFEKILQEFITKKIDSVGNYYSFLYNALIHKKINKGLLKDFSSDDTFYIAAAYILLVGYDKGISSAHFYEELVKFEKKFGNYIEDEFKINNRLIKFKLRDLIADVTKYYEITSIDTFNYTPIENDVYFFNLTKNIYHINGSTNTHPIFGYDYDEKDKFSEKFSKTFRRIRSTDYCETYSNKYPLMEQFDDLVIFGHSLCKMDYSYYFPIFNYMHILEANYKSRIVIYYHNDEKNDRRNELVFAFVDMMKQYTLEMEGKVNPRLIDSLSIQGRLLFVSI